MHPKKECCSETWAHDPEKAKPSVLRSAQQVSGRGPSASPGLEVGVSLAAAQGVDGKEWLGVLLCATEPGWEWGQRTDLDSACVQRPWDWGGVPKAWGWG